MKISIQVENTPIGGETALVVVGKSSNFMNDLPSGSINQQSKVQED